MARFTLLKLGLFVEARWTLDYASRLIKKITSRAFRASLRRKIKAKRASLVTELANVERILVITIWTCSQTFKCR